LIRSCGGKLADLVKADICSHDGSSVVALDFNTPQQKDLKFLSNEEAKLYIQQGNSQREVCCLK
jgi:carbamate kinase